MLQNSYKNSKIDNNKKYEKVETILTKVVFVKYPDILLKNEGFYLYHWTHAWQCMTNPSVWQYDILYLHGYPDSRIFFASEYPENKIIVDSAQRCPHKA